MTHNTQNNPLKANQPDQSDKSLSSLEQQNYWTTILTLAEKAWSQFWELFIDLLASSDQPQIKERRDRNGQIYWRVYDPASESYIFFYCRQEVCAWLETYWLHHRR